MCPTTNFILSLRVALFIEHIRADVCVCVTSFWSAHAETQQIHLACDLRLMRPAAQISHFYRVE